MGDTARANASAAAEEQKARQAQRDASAIVVTKLLDGKKTAAEVAGVIRAHPRYEMDFMDYLNKTFGNAFVMSVWDELDKIDEVAKPTTDSVSDVRNLSDLNSVPEKAQPASMPVEDKRSERLPYDGRGGWDAVQINTKLGQYDNIAGTDNDDDRCAYATLVAAKVFDGPQVFGTWLGAFRRSHGGESSFLLEKQHAAVAVIEVVAKAIKDGTATFRDMSWLQEALYDYSISALNDEWTDKQGVDSTSELITSSTDSVGAGGGTHSNAADVIKNTKSLKKGSNMMVEWKAKRVGATQGFRHEMMISNHDGKLYLYDASGTIDGTHLKELTPATLVPYFTGDFKDSTMTLANTLAGKAGLATD
jgi:hypothetical protein